MRRILQAVAVCAALLPLEVAACAVLSPFAVDSLVAADIILTGEVTGYQDLYSVPGAALVKVQVAEVIKGEVGADMVLIWNAGMATGPHEPLAQGKVLIGTMAPGRAADPARTDLRPDLPMIVQPLCGEVWIRPVTPALVAGAKAVAAE